MWDKKDVIGVTGFVVVAALFLWLLIAGLAADDIDYWQQQDDNADCYTHVSKFRNFWPIPGENYSTRETYCRVKE